MGILTKLKTKAKEISGEIKHDYNKAAGKVKEGAEAYKKYQKDAPQRQKKEIAKLKFQTQKAQLEAQKLGAQNKLRQLREARYSATGAPAMRSGFTPAMRSGFTIGGQIGNTSPRKLKPKKKKKKSKSITINF